MKLELEGEAWHAHGVLEDSAEREDLRRVGDAHPDRQLVHSLIANSAIDDGAVYHIPHGVIAVVLSDEEQQRVPPTLVHSAIVPVPLGSSQYNRVEPPATLPVARVLPKKSSSYSLRMGGYCASWTASSAASSQGQKGWD